ncbi:hypothetical protein [Sphingobium aquiterrae]|uniref:hypothetical protein n=1 Tax=Sphingobium aquiterrae TaxID=2038656 RepID=UPI00301B02C2
MTMFWTTAIALAGFYCLVRGAQDLRQKRYVWGVLGLCCGAIILLTPVPGQTVNITLPAPTPAARH